MNRCSEFAAKLASGDVLAGIFQKFQTHQAVELISFSAMDFVVLDAEHAPFDASQIDASLLASKAYDVPMLVRVPRNEPDTILSVLDMGANGIFVPHVRSPEDAAKAVRASRYKGGNRGFSPSTRAGGYGDYGHSAYMSEADRTITVVLQIEDTEALNHLDEIAAIEGVGGLFVGRADLAVSMNLDWNDRQLDDATLAIAAAARKAGVAAGSYLADTSRLPEFLDLGVNFYLIGSDQGAMKQQVRGMAKTFHDLAAAWEKDK